MVVHERGQFHSPHLKNERTVSDRKLVPRPQRSARGTKAKKEQIEYTAPPNMPLVPVTRSMTIIAHASPEDGYPVLTDFQAKTTSHRRLLCTISLPATWDYFESIAGSSFNTDHPALVRTLQAVFYRDWASSYAWRLS